MLLFILVVILCLTLDRQASTWGIPSRVWVSPALLLCGSGSPAWDAGERQEVAWVLGVPDLGGVWMAWPAVHRWG